MHNRLMMAAVALALLVSCAGPQISAQGPEVRATDSAKLLVDAKGMALYTYDEDKPGNSACSGTCAIAWPPAMAATGARPHDGFSLITRPDGSKQWAYMGQPLYGYFRDSQPGETSGDGVDGVWHVAHL